jgi:hypothetical protein
MIENDEQLRATHEALGSLYRALASLRHRLLPINPQQYRLFAEGPLDEIRKLQSEIDTYLGLEQPAAEPAATLNETPPPFPSGKT